MQRDFNIVRGGRGRTFHLNIAFSYASKLVPNILARIVGPILANIFLSHHEENWLNKCPIKLKPCFYRRYVNDIFVLFESSESAESFREYMSSKHPNINFNATSSDVKICRKNGKFGTSVYRKPTFSGVFNNYESFIPTYQKRGLLHTFLHRSFSICCDLKTFLFEIDHLKTILIKTITPWIS